MQIFGTWDNPNVDYVDGIFGLQPGSMQGRSFFESLKQDQIVEKLMFGISIQTTN